MNITLEFLRHVQAAEGFLELGLLDESATELGEIEPELRSHPDVLAVRLNIYAARDWWPEMAMLARRLVTIQPQEPRWWIHLAGATRNSESVEAARATLLCAAKNHPEEPMIKYKLASYACQLGFVEEAKAYLAEAIRRATGLKASAVDDPDLSPLWDSLAVELPPLP